MMQDHAASKADRQDADRPASKSKLRRNLNAVGAEIQALQNAVARLQGDIAVLQQNDEANGGSLGDLADVNVQNLAEDDALLFDGAAMAWRNVSTKPLLQQIPMLIHAPTSASYLVTGSLPFDVRLRGIVHTASGGSGAFSLMLSGNVLAEYTNIPFTEDLGMVSGSRNQMAADTDALSLVLSTVAPGTREAWFGIQYERL